jgi:hypothetical protein
LWQAVSPDFYSQSMAVLACVLAGAFGIFTALAPARSAAIWGRKGIRMRWYRTFGVVLCAAGVLYAADSYFFAQYHRPPVVFR